MNSSLLVLTIGCLASSAALAEKTPEAKADLVVKAITMQPFKEAIIVHGGRTYTVRPGDRVGTHQVVDISAEGLKTQSGTFAVVASQAATPTSTEDAKPSASPSSELVMKSFSLKPFKEAVVQYKDRVYTVRPNDTLAGYRIKDITAKGLVTEPVAK